MTSVWGLKSRDQSVPRGRDQRPSWRQRRPKSGPGAAPTWLPGAAPCGAERGRSVLGSLAQNLSFVFPQLDANSLTKPGQCATSTLMDNKVVFMPGGVAAPPRLRWSLCYKALLQKYVELLHLYL